MPKIQAMLFQQTSVQAVKLTSSHLVHYTEIQEFFANHRGNIPNRQSVLNARSYEKLQLLLLLTI